MKKWAFLVTYAYMTIFSAKNIFSEKLDIFMPFKRCQETLT